jgi:hypothetical protein
MIHIIFYMLGQITFICYCCMLFCCNWRVMPVCLPACFISEATYRRQSYLVLEDYRNSGLINFILIGVNSYCRRSQPFAGQG